MSPTRPDILFIMTDQQRFDTIAAPAIASSNGRQVDEA